MKHIVTVVFAAFVAVATPAFAVENCNTMPTPCGSGSYVPNAGYSCLAGYSLCHASAGNICCQQGMAASKPVAAKPKGKGKIGAPAKIDLGPYNK